MLWLCFAGWSFCLENWQDGSSCSRRRSVIDTGALSHQRPPLTGPAGNMFKESSVCSHWVEMCKTPTECSRESTRRWLFSLKHHQENRWALTNFRENTETLYRNSGQLAVSRPSLHFISQNTHKKSSELLLLLFINSPTAHTIWILSSSNEQE